MKKRILTLSLLLIFVLSACDGTKIDDTATLTNITLGGITDIDAFVGEQVKLLDGITALGDDGLSYYKEIDLASTCDITHGMIESATEQTCEVTYSVTVDTVNAIETITVTFTDDPTTILANTDNPIQLNTGNQDGWTFDTNGKTEPVLTVKNGVLSFTQQNKEDDLGTETYLARQFIYDSLNFEEINDYEISFTANGTNGETFTVMIKTGEEAYRTFEYTLTGNDQTISIAIENPVGTTYTGEFILALGTFENGSELMVSNIEITAEVHEDAIINVLFIGNSFTYYNDLPTMVEDMGIAEGKAIHVEQITYGGYQLIEYITLTSPAAQEVKSKLEERDWDYVVLQEQSKKPLDNLSEFLSSVDTLDALITSKGAETILYSTWSYRDGTDKLATTGLSYTGFYNVLTNAYQQAATNTDSLIAPVGTAFYNLTIDHPEINLLQDDDFHPLLSGSYVAACIFYAVIFDEADTQQYIPSGLSSTVATTLREYALNALDSTE